MKTMIHGPITAGELLELNASCIISALEEVRTERAFLEQHPMITSDDLAIFAAQEDHRAPALRYWVRDSCELARFIHNG